MHIKRNRITLIALALFIVIVAWLLAGYSAGKIGAMEDKPFEADSFAMGTVISQKVYGANGQRAINEAKNKIAYLDKLLTFNDTQGDIYKLNQNAGIGGVELDPETVEILKKAQRVSEMSKGVFDITVGPLVKTWGIGTDKAHIPSDEELHNLLPLINYRDLDIDNNFASLKKKGQMVDLGGIAKGYAGDAVIKVYKKYGIKSAFISLGGNVVTLGSKPDGTPWKVGIRNPRPSGTRDGETIGIVKVTNKAVVTAGDDQRYFIENGQRYHHILDPGTGYPAKSDLMSVTLITDSSFDADALDTAVYILGLEKGRDLIQRYGGIEAVFVTSDKKVYITQGLKDKFRFLGEKSGYVYVQ